MPLPNGCRAVGQRTRRNPASENLATIIWQPVCRFCSARFATVISVSVQDGVGAVDCAKRTDVSPGTTVATSEEGASRPDVDGLSAGAAAGGEIEIAGHRYATKPRLAAALGLSERTLDRWEARRIGPPKIKVGRLVLYDLARVPEWLASLERHPVRTASRRKDEVR